MDERRYIGLDALRGCMMLLGIVLHSAMLYLASPPQAMPLPTDRNSSEVFDVLFDLIHSFRMPIFFLVAGFFAALMVNRRGIQATWRNRVSRILWPLLAALLVILPLTAWLTLSFWVDARFGSRSLMPDLQSILALGAETKEKIGPRAEHPSMAHLWFLYYLCMFYALIPLCQWALQKTAHLQARIQHFFSQPSAAVVFALWTALTLWPYQGAQVHEGFFYFIPHPPSLLYYGAFFVLGYAFHAYQGFLQATVRYMRWAWVLAAALFPLSLMASSADTDAGGENAWLHLTAVLLNGLCTWAFIYGFFGAAQRFFDRLSRSIDYAAQSAYWVYLVHLPLIMLAGWFLLAFDAPALFKFVLVCMWAAALAFASFHYVVQNSWLAMFLYGRRLGLRWPWQQQAPSVQ